MLARTFIHGLLYLLSHMFSSLHLYYSQSSIPFTTCHYNHYNYIQTFLMASIKAWKSKGLANTVAAP